MQGSPVAVQPPPEHPSAWQAMLSDVHFLEMAPPRVGAAQLTPSTPPLTVCMLTSPWCCQQHASHCTPACEGCLCWSVVPHDQLQVRLCL